MLQLQRTATLLLCLACVGVAACEGRVTEEDLQKWATNEVGLRRIRAFMAEPQPIEVKARAIEVLVERCLEVHVRQVVDSVPDVTERKQLVAVLVSALIAHIDERRPTLLQAKDAIVSLQGVLPEDLQTRFREAVATWAFADINWELSPEELGEKMQARLSAGQIVDLGPRAWEPAAILLASGFAHEQFVRFLAGTKDPGAAQLLVRALRAYRDKPNQYINAFHLDALGRLEHGDSALFLLELARGETLSEPELQLLQGLTQSFGGVPNV
jgi:hypothetical protein